MNLKKRILSLCFVLYMSISAHGCTIYENKSSSDATSSVSETFDTQFQKEEISSVATTIAVTTELITQAPLLVSKVTENTAIYVVEPVGMDYIVNTNTGKFHYLFCLSVNQMAEHNKMAYTGSRDNLIAQGYAPCKRCNP